MGLFEFLKKTKIKREDGYLYYIGKDGYVWAAPMKHNKMGKKKRVSKVKLSESTAFERELGKDDYIYRAKLKNA